MLLLLLVIMMVIRLVLTRHVKSGIIMMHVLLLLCDGNEAFLLDMVM